MNAILDYKILSDTTPENLVIQVNNLMRFPEKRTDIWIPQGGISVAETDNSYSLHQAMVRVV
jgi:hypothetical protein